MKLPATIVGQHTTAFNWKCEENVFFSFMALQYACDWNRKTKSNNVQNDLDGRCDHGNENDDDHEVEDHHRQIQAHRNLLYLG